MLYVLKLKLIYISYSLKSAHDLPCKVWLRIFFGPSPRMMDGQMDVQMTTIPFWPGMAKW